ncbi:MAG: 50S ribosomal protein L18 [Ignavibacteria bacterium]|jgi:large subunit ribosomal protein L18|nr:50S ribosomal protein L18 [Ignavibacteria bacterium]MBK6876723.1 50S ribosomal protein L18 [Ignavibacteria bacterium]MBK9229096.1 50S ribosomal protein L18 [Ignavibacteria bacterium]
MNKVDRSNKRRARIKHQIRKKVGGTAEKPRMVVYRSLNHIYTQLIDDSSGKTIFSVSSKSKDIAEKLAGSKGRIEMSKLVGKLAAEKAISQNISSVIFDRNGFLYHGRVKAVADGAREGGLKF